MPSRRFHFNDAALEAGFAKIRDELDIAITYPAAVMRQAQNAAKRGPQFPPGAGGTKVVDRRELSFVAVDPPGARDLDQIFAAERRGDGYRIFYGIADLAAFISPESALDMHARKRGVTLYSPDMRASLHPEVINEDVASLLPGQDRQALLWTIDIDSSGELTSAHIERAMVHNRRAMTYSEAQAEIDNGTADESLSLLKPIGELRREREIARGAVSLQLPSQEITRQPLGYELHYDVTLPVENWNAQISLLTGIAAASIMLDGGEGLLRTLPPADDFTIAELRATARGLGLEWADDVSYADRVRSLTPADPREAALLTRSARGLRGAGYVAFHNGELPEHPEHSAIASTYAHVTAPLRRVCDRFANEILLANCADRPVPSWASEAIDDLPAVMGRASQRDRSLERTIVDYVETMCLQHRVGETFPAVVTNLNRDRDYATLMVAEPAVIAPIEDGSLELGSTLDVKLVGVDVDKRRVTFERAPATT